MLIKADWLTKWSKHRREHSSNGPRLGGEGQPSWKQVFFPKCPCVLDTDCVCVFVVIVMYTITFIYRWSIDIYMHVICIYIYTYICIIIHIYIFIWIYVCIYKCIFLNLDWERGLWSISQCNTTNRRAHWRFVLCPSKCECITKSSNVREVSLSLWPAIERNGDRGRHKWEVMFNSFFLCIYVHIFGISLVQAVIYVYINTQKKYEYADESLYENSVNGERSNLAVQTVDAFVKGLQMGNQYCR
jgi:hypothetical protein